MIEISNADRQSPGWIRLMEYLALRLNELRRTNDHDADAIETATTRGRIAEVKMILSLNEEAIDE